MSKVPITLDDNQWKRVTARVCQSLMNKDVLTWVAYSKLLKTIIFKVCAIEKTIDGSSDDFDPDRHNLNEETISTSIVKANQVLKNFNMKIQREDENWVQEESENGKTFIILRSTQTASSLTKVSDQKGFWMKGLKNGSNEAKFLVIVLSSLMNSDIDKECMSLDELCRVKGSELNLKGKFNLPRTFEKDKEYWIGEYIKMGYLSKVEGSRRLITLSKRFRKENPKLMDKLLFKDESDTQDLKGRMHFLANICMCEEGDDLNRLLMK